MRQKNPFTKAASRLKGRWTKGCYRRRDGRVCLVGAVMTTNDLRRRDIATTAYYSPTPKGEYLRAYLVNALPEPWTEPESFNDWPDTSEEDVLLVLKQAEYQWDMDRAEKEAELR